jgi:hypothetical protein
VLAALIHEIHSDKEDFDLTPGQNLTLNWGISQFLPLSKDQNSGNGLDAILRKYRIGGDHWHVVHLGCGNHHPVARIGVNSRQCRRADANL